MKSVQSLLFFKPMKEEPEEHHWSTKGMTEEEAKTKWCPMVRATCIYQNESYNRDGNGSYVDALCIASDCMMWRWYNSQKATGHCGLGGKP